MTVEHKLNLHHHHHEPHQYSHLTEQHLRVQDIIHQHHQQQNNYISQQQHQRFGLPLAAHHQQHHQLQLLHPRQLPRINRHSNVDALAGQVRALKYLNQANNANHINHNTNDQLTEHEQPATLEGAKHVATKPPPEDILTWQKRRIRFTLLATLAYIISPIDLIPEAIFGIFGIFDDILVSFTCMFTIAMILLYPVVRDIRQKALNIFGMDPLDGIS